MAALHHADAVPRACEPECKTACMPSGAERQCAEDQYSGYPDDDRAMPGQVHRGVGRRCVYGRRWGERGFGSRGGRRREWLGGLALRAGDGFVCAIAHRVLHV